MLKKALKSNSTLKIVENKEYEIFDWMNIDLVVVINDAGDEIIMTRFNFEK